MTRLIPPILAVLNHDVLNSCKKIGDGPEGSDAAADHGVDPEEHVNVAAGGAAFTTVCDLAADK